MTEVLSIKEAYLALIETDYEVRIVLRHPEDFPNFLVNHSQFNQKEFDQKIRDRFMAALPQIAPYLPEAVSLLAMDDTQDYKTHKTRPGYKLYYLPHTNQLYRYQWNMVDDSGDIISVDVSRNFDPGSESFLGFDRIGKFDFLSIRAANFGTNLGKPDTELTPTVIGRMINEAKRKVSKDDQADIEKLRIEIDILKGEYGIPTLNQLIPRCVTKLKEGLSLMQQAISQTHQLPQVVEIDEVNQYERVFYLPAQQRTVIAERVGSNDFDLTNAIEFPDYLLNNWFKIVHALLPDPSVLTTEP